MNNVHAHNAAADLALSIYPKYRRWRFRQKLKAPFYQFATWLACAMNEVILMRFGWAIVGDYAPLLRAWKGFRVIRLTNAA